MSFKFYFSASQLKGLLFSTFLLGLVTVSFGQGNGNGNNGNGNGNGGGDGNKPGKGKGPHSDNRTPLAAGMVYSNGQTATTTVFTPTGYGSTQAFGFATLGGTPDQLYGTIPDMALRIGGGIGDARKIASVMAMVNVNDVSRFRSFSYSFIGSHQFSNNFSVSAGALHLFADTAISDGVRSLYVSFSGRYQKLTYTLGVGDGNFYLKSPDDIKAGKGEYGTGVFGSISYDVLKNWTVNAEWTGMNLALTTAYRLPKGLPVLYAGVADITRYSGNKATLVFGLGKAFGFK